MSATESPTDNIHRILRQYWGFDEFRPLQEDIVRSVLEGRDTLALMPTGGGKSVCYQVPAMAKEGLCLVISPLIALMKDQVMGLRKKNITAYSIFSGMSRQEVRKTLSTVINSNCKFLFVSPERLETALFKEFLPGMNINLVAVDEAHCISQWGYDFRPPYLRIAALRTELKNVPVLALTASATQEVQDDICTRLEFQEGKIFRSSFARPNLSYSAFRVDSRINKILDILNKVPGSAIVYCRSRRRTKEISDLLQMHNISSDYYHAGLGQEDRNRKQEEWINNTTRVIACTNAFGMGIDKPDVRVVIHADIPDCLENYYQEAGRAGRDRNRSYAILLYDEPELEEMKELPNKRYPDPQEIKNVYEAVVNFLGIPPGSGQYEYYDFDIADFVGKFKLNSFSTSHALKTLEQEGWLSFNEQVFLPSTIRFTTDRNYLFEFEKQNPTDEPVIKTLLRTYEGIFDFQVPISELLMANLVGRHLDDIKLSLTNLHKRGNIEYTPQKDTPQLYMLRERIKISEFTINRLEYNKRKARFEKRIGEMISFAKETDGCRSGIIGEYFGDSLLADCGICDNCLRRKKEKISKEEFEVIRQKIHVALMGKALHTKELLAGLQGIGKEKAWSVIEFLQSEKKIEVDKAGWIRLAN